MTIHIAIIGAGIAGLSLAHLLNQHAGERVRVILHEKARGVSGRMTTRYHEHYDFDHGAQYFTARSPEFQAFLAPFITAGEVTAWHPRVTTLSPIEAPYKRDWFEPHYVASPRMNHLCKILAENQHLQLTTEITHLIRTPAHQWTLHDKAGNTHGAYDWVISTAPAPQTATLVAPLGIWQDALQQVEMLPCITLMLGLHALPPLPFDAAKVKDSAIDWIALNHTKPQRGELPCIVAHSTAAWAAAHIEQDPALLHDLLLEALQPFIPLTPAQIAYSTAHRWRYADVATPLAEPYLLDSSLHLAACGDWCIVGKVEGAFLSAMQLCNRLIGHL